MPVDHSGRWESAVFGDQLDDLFTVLQRLGACSIEQEVEGDEMSSSSDDDDESIACAPAAYQVAARMKRIAEKRMNCMHAELEMAVIVASRGARRGSEGKGQRDRGTGGG